MRYSRTKSTKTNTKMSDMLLERPPTFRIENEYNPEIVPQFFQICVYVIEARRLVYRRPEHMTSYVQITIGKEQERTSVKKNMQQPHYKQYFVFDLYLCLRDLLKSTVKFAVMEPKCCGPAGLVGQTFIDMATIWSQPHHQIYHKWALLSLPTDALSGPRGFLKIDISILSKGEAQFIPSTVDEDTIEDNILSPSAMEQQRTNFLTTIYSAYNLSNGRFYDSNNTPHLALKAPSTFVRITFSGMVAKTGLKKKTFHPIFNEQISMTEMFPNVNQYLRMEVCSLEICTRVLATAHIKLCEISHDGDNGFLPTFGPAFIHLYGDSQSAHNSLSENGPFYKGSMIVSFKTILPYYQHGLRYINVEPIPPLQEDALWTAEEIYVSCAILEVSMLDKKRSKPYTIAMTMGDVPEIMYTTEKDKKSNPASDKVRRNRKYYCTSPMKIVKPKSSVYGYLECGPQYPIIQLVATCPDSRFRMYKNNMLKRIICSFRNSLTDIELRITTYDYDSVAKLNSTLEHAIDEMISGVQKYIDVKKSQDGDEGKDSKIVQTELDMKQSKLQDEELGKLLQSFKSKKSVMTIIKKTISSKVSYNKSYDKKVTRKLVRLTLAEGKEYLGRLENLFFNVRASWPDVIIWLVSGVSRLAYAKIRADDLIYSPIAGQCGEQCGRVQTLFFKPVKCPKHLTTLSTGCFCIFGKMEVYAWMGLQRQNSNMSFGLPSGYEVKFNESNTPVRLEIETICVECKVYIYRAKMTSGFDSSGLADPYVRVNIFNKTCQTSIKFKTLIPLWNQSLIFPKAVINSSTARFKTFPTLAIVEVYDFDSKVKSELMGRVPVQVDFDGYKDVPPNLQWYDLYKGVQVTGQILMSAHIIEHSSLTEADAHPVHCDKVDSIPESIQPKITSYKIDIYWWGLRNVNLARKPCVILQIDELSIKSEIIKDSGANCNFPNGRITEVFEAPLHETYCPPISIRLYDSSTFGRSVFLGTNVLKNPSKFIIEWVPKDQREASLKSLPSDMSKRGSSNFHPAQLVQKSYLSLHADSKYLNDIYTAPNFLNNSASDTKAIPSNGTLCNKTDFVMLALMRKKNRKKRNAATQQSIMDMDDVKIENDWWTRFLCSRKTCADNAEINNSNIEIYNSELESQPEFRKFKDWCSTLKLYHGKKTGIPEKDEKLYRGYLKAGIVIYKWPPPNNLVAVTPCGVDLNSGYFQDHPPNLQSKYLIRVYLVRAFNLIPKDYTGKADPYVVIKCGKKRLGDRKSYVSNSLNPVFGKLHELHCNLPEDYSMAVSIYDYDTLCGDDLIGITNIDLEDRVYTKHRARCGLAKEYTTLGCGRWRDSEKPSQILSMLCSQNYLPEPVFPDEKTVVLNGIQYKDPDNEKLKSKGDRLENLCLKLLHDWTMLPMCGFKLVPEHVETRTLYNPVKPGMDQGKLQMWIDIFPLDTGQFIPDPIVITPRKPDEYELRLIVWNAEEVTLQDYNLITGEHTSDIYVKIWLGDVANAQSTDIHYHSLTGEANFNWRMIFAFQYQHAERGVVLPKAPWIGDGSEELTPAHLHVQVMDNDILSSDDYLGSLILDLHAIPKGAANPQLCTLDKVTKATKVDLFQIKSLRGWWPIKREDGTTGKDIISGKVDLEIHLISKEKAARQPAGCGREGPQPLPPPNRPDTSFNSFTNPFRSFKYFLKNRGGKHLGACILISLVVSYLVLTYLELPKIMLEKLLNTH